MPFLLDPISTEPHDFASFPFILNPFFVIRVRLRLIFKKPLEGFLQVGKSRSQLLSYRFCVKLCQALYDKDIASRKGPGFPISHYQCPAPSECRRGRFRE